MRSAGTTLRKFASGSPMPMSTTFVTARSSGRPDVPSSRFASQTCPTISAVVRLRLNPCCAVEQKEQSSAHPTCEEMHSVPRSGSGMNTISNACFSSARSSHLRVPSADCCDVTISGTRISARSASCARKAFARSVIASKPLSPRLYTQLQSWRARKGSLPSSRTNTSSSGRVRPSRFWRSMRGASDMSVGLRGGSAARVEIGAGEEERNLARGGIRGIRAVHDVPLDALGEVGANGAGRSFLRIGGAHDFAILRDGVVAFEHLHDDRTGGHVAHQVLVERALLVDGVERLGLELREVTHASGNDGQAGLFEAAIDLADEITGHAVRLDDGQGALERHEIEASEPVEKFKYPAALYAA